MKTPRSRFALNPTPTTVEEGGEALLQHKLNRSHVAYLRALVQGVSSSVAAAKYLGADHGHQVAGLHRWTIDVARAVARKGGHSAWRLLGVELRAPNPVEDPPPTLAEWVEAKGYDGFSHEEQLQWYQEEFAAGAGNGNGMGAKADHKVQRRDKRNARLLERRLRLVDHLEKLAAVDPSPLDAVEIWFSDESAKRLRRAGVVNLESLQTRVRLGGCWWSDLPGVGVVKAKRIEAAIRSLLPTMDLMVRVFTLRTSPANLTGHAAGHAAGQANQPGTVDLSANMATYMGVNTPQYTSQPGGAGSLAGGYNRGPIEQCLTTASSDREAIAAWIEARSKSESSARSYYREAIRFLVFCEQERKLGFAGVRVGDCGAYLQLLSDVPVAWVSRKRAKPFTPGWAPFKGQLSPAARKLALVAVQGLFNWLVKVGYLARNPWGAVSQKQGDAPIQLPASKAIPVQAWDAVLAHVQGRAASPTDRQRMAAMRMAFVMRFGLGTGLRASELLGATLGQIVDAGRSGWVITVVGKGKKARLVPIPPSALSALTTYMQQRKSEWRAPNQDVVPLVPSLEDPDKPVSYRVFLRSFKSMMAHAVKACGLSAEHGARVLDCALHSLRHTHATRFAEANQPVTVLQANLGHADSRTTSGYYQHELSERASVVESVFG